MTGANTTTHITHPGTPTLLDELTICAFRRWLERHRRAFGERHSIGLTASASSCPLSMFLQAQGFTDVSVTYFKVEGKRQGVTFSMEQPDWAQRFLTVVDSLGGPFTPESIAWSVRVTTTQALELLDQVERTLDQPFSEWVQQVVPPAGRDTGKERVDGEPVHAG